MTPLVELQQVSLTLSQRSILQSINLQVAAGEIVTLIGPNGAGKSSLVKLVCGLLSPSSGRLWRQEQLRIGYVPQRLQVDAHLPIKVGRFLRLTGASQQACLAQLQGLQIDHLHNSLLHNLSGGEWQRVLLARALLRAPQLLILDEPAQGVDVTGQLELYRTIAGLRDQLGCGVLMVSHDLHWVMAQTDTVYCLNRHLCCQGAPERVSQHPAYLELFGKEAAALAVYTHHHDHEHNLHGEVVSHPTDCASTGCQHHHG
jgi:zinc transport system ATP-binding protein